MKLTQNRILEQFEALGRTILRIRTYSGTCQERGVPQVGFAVVELVDHRSIDSGIVWEDRDRVENVDEHYLAAFMQVIGARLREERQRRADEDNAGKASVTLTSAAGVKVAV